MRPAVAALGLAMVMCLTSYALFGMLAFLLSSSPRAPTVIVIGLWAAFVAALACRRWRWAGLLALLPVPALLMFGLIF